MTEARQRARRAARANVNILRHTAEIGTPESISLVLLECTGLCTLSIYIGSCYLLICKDSRAASSNISPWITILVQLHRNVIA